MAANMGTLTALATALWTVACASAQSPAPAVPAPAPGGAESITAADVSRRVHLIAHDSMGGRGTPSPGLEMMAAYVAAEFRRLGLAPGGDSGSYIQRYPLEVYASRPESSSVWATGRVPGRWGLGQEIKFGQGTLTSSHMVGDAVLWTGTPQPDAALDPASVAGKVVIVVPGAGDLPGAMQLIQAKPAAIVAVLDLPDQVWPQVPDQLQGRQVRKPEETGPLVVPPVLFTRDTTFAPWLAQVGVNVDSARAAMTGPLTITALSGVELHLALDQRKVESTTAPNVVGVLEGSDPVLKGE